jgi:exodeoxyribonuclease-3
MFKIATWNVNSLRVRLPHVLQWLETANPDVLALQETKIIDDDFPFAEFKQAGYECFISGQKTYNGMAIITKSSGSDIVTDIPQLNDPQRRVLAVTIGDTRILNLYVPNGESVDSEKYGYKLNWLHHLNLFVQQELEKHSKYIILGDFNIAPEDIDVHDPKRWQGKVLFSEKERAALQSLLNLGLSDCFRLHTPAEKSFTWWDYRLNAFQRNWGLRIDHVFASASLASACINCYIDKEPRIWERPSDHVPVIAEFNSV